MVLDSQQHLLCAVLLLRVRIVYPITHRDDFCRYTTQVGFGFGIRVLQYPKPGVFGLLPVLRSLPRTGVQITGEP